MRGQAAGRESVQQRSLALVSGGFGRRRWVSSEWREKKVEHRVKSGMEDTGERAIIGLARKLRKLL